VSLHRFGVFEFDGGSGELRRQGRRIALAPQPGRLLGLLLDRAGDVVSKDDIRELLWPGGTVVEFEAGIASSIRQIRVALGDRAGSSRFVETLPRRGYRFVAPILLEGPAPAGDTATGGVSPSTIPPRDSRLRPGLLVIGVVLLAGTAAAVTSFFRRSSRAESLPAVGILPVRHAASETELETPAEIVGESFATAILDSARGRATVLSRLATERFPEKWRPEDMHRLPAAFVVDCSLHRLGNSEVRLHTKLARTRDFRILWTRDFNFPLDRLLADVDGVTRRAAASMVLAVEPGDAERDIPARDTPAYDRWLSARHALLEGDPMRAIAKLEDSIRLDSRYAAVHATLAEAVVVAVRMGTMTFEAGAPIATAALRRSWELDPELPEGRAALGGVLWLRHRPALAQRYLRQALGGNPRHVLARIWLASALAAEGRRADAECEAQKALSLDPTWTYVLREAQIHALTDIPT